VDTLQQLTKESYSVANTESRLLSAHFLVFFTTQQKSPEVKSVQEEPFKLVAEGQRRCSTEAAPGVASMNATGLREEKAQENSTS